MSKGGAIHIISNHPTRPCGSTFTRASTRPLPRSCASDLACRSALASRMASPAVGKTSPDSSSSNARRSLASVAAFSRGPQPNSRRSSPMPLWRAASRVDMRSLGRASKLETKIMRFPAVTAAAECHTLPVHSTAVPGQARTRSGGEGAEGGGGLVGPNAPGRHAKASPTHAPHSTQCTTSSLSSSHGSLQYGSHNLTIVGPHAATAAASSAASAARVVVLLSTSASVPSPSHGGSPANTVPPPAKLPAVDSGTSTVSACRSRCLG